MLEAMIAYHCAPALAGIKPANMVTCQKSHIPEIHAEIKKLNQELNVTDIYLEVIGECESRVLVMVYRKKILQRHLQVHNHRAFLSMYGYPQNGSMAEDLNHLKARLVQDTFPHEIGVFLGYPLRDIYAFIHHRDKGCLLIGEWRVYHNAEEAEKLFCRFKSCRKALVEHITQRGKTLAQIFCAA